MLGYYCLCTRFHFRCVGVLFVLIFDYVFQSHASDMYTVHNNQHEDKCMPYEALYSVITLSQKKMNTRST